MDLLQCIIHLPCNDSSSRYLKTALANLYILTLQQQQQLLYQLMISEQLLLIIISAYFALSLLLLYFPTLIHKRKRYNYPLFNQLIDDKGVLCIGHRGGAFQGAENTMDTFRKTEIISHMFQLDVCETKDQKIVVCHDKNLLRLCGVDKKVQEFNYEDLPPLLESYQPYGRVQPMKTQKPRIPLLQDLFKAFPEKLINIDLKTPSPSSIAELNRLVTSYKRQSITVWTIIGHENQKLRAINPSVKNCYQTSDVLKIIILLMTGLLPFVPLRDGFLQVPFISKQVRKNLEVQVKGVMKYITILVYHLIRKLGRVFIPHLRKRGILTFFWVVNEKEDFRTAVSIGCAGIITDQPFKLASYLRKEGIYYGETNEKCQ